MKTQFITDNAGNKTGIILSIEEYQKLLEELACVRAYDKAKARNEKTLPLKKAIELRKKSSK